MSNEIDLTQLDRIERMLTSVLKSNNHIQWIGGYVYGRTSKDDPFIILYPASDKLERKACRVYGHEFKKLPLFISRDVPANAQNANPDRSQAMRQGIYNPCQLFQITLYNGRVTEMGPEQRFGNVIRVSENKPVATPPPPVTSNQPVPGVRADAYNKGYTPPPPAAPLPSGKRPAYTRQPMNGRQDEPASTPDDLRAAVLGTFIEEHFNTAVVDWLDYFTDAATVAVAREHMWGEFDPAHVAGYAAGLRSYAGSVTTQIATGQGLDLEFKKTAVKRAKAAFDKAIDNK